MRDEIKDRLRKILDDNKENAGQLSSASPQRIAGHHSGRMTTTASTDFQQHHTEAATTSAYLNHPNLQL